MGATKTNNIVEKILAKRSWNKPKGLIQISVIAMTILAVFSYSMLQINIVDEGQKKSNTSWTKLSAWQTIQTVATDFFKHSQQEIPEVNAQYLARYDKNNLTKLKQGEKILERKCENIIFPDTKGHTFELDIKHAAEYCLINGYENGRFYPDNHLKYGDFLHMLNNGFKLVLDNNIATSVMKDMITLNKEEYEVLTNEDIAIIVHNLDSIHNQKVTLDYSNEIAKRWYAVHVLNKIVPIVEKAEKLEPIENYAVTSEEETTKEVRNTKYEWINWLVQNNIVDQYDESLAKPLTSISREKFISLLIKAKQSQNTSIPTNIINTSYFADVKNNNSYISELTLAKIMGITSFLETIERGETYLNPSKPITLYEAITVINQNNKNEITTSLEDDTVLLTYESAAKLIKQMTITTDRDYVQTNESEKIENNPDIGDPWFVESLRPIVRELTNMM